jgi:hypothetical protein
MRLVVELEGFDLAYPERFAGNVKRLLDQLVERNREYMRLFPLPPLYQSGVSYRTDPPGRVSLADAPTVYHRKWGHCAHLSCWLTAELNERGIGATLRIKWAPRKGEYGLPGTWRRGQKWVRVVPAVGGCFEFRLSSGRILTLPLEVWPAIQDLLLEQGWSCGRLYHEQVRLPPELGAGPPGLGQIEDDTNSVGQILDPSRMLGMGRKQPSWQARRQHSQSGWAQSLWSARPLQ